MAEPIGLLITTYAPLPKFFALHKPHRTAGVEVESGETLAEIQHNPILEEFAAHYDREARFFAGGNGA